MVHIVLENDNVLVLIKRPLKGVVNVKSFKNTHLIETS